MPINKHRLHLASLYPGTPPQPRPSVRQLRHLVRGTWPVAEQEVFSGGVTEDAEGSLGDDDDPTPLLERQYL